MRREGVVLVGVLKNRRDLTLLVRERWYRVPLRSMPKKKFAYLAFYQPAIFGARGKCIRYYARVLGREKAPRGKLLPEEPWHPRAEEEYVRVRLGPLRELRRPVQNALPRRISFGFTTLGRLLHAKTVLGLYGVAATEEMVEDALRRAGISFRAQYYVNAGRRYFLDFAIFCRRGKIAVECDNRKAHGGGRQRARDAAKDKALREKGWTVARLREEEIVSDVEGCVMKIKKAMRRQGGVG